MNKLDKSRGLNRIVDGIKWYNGWYGGLYTEIDGNLIGVSNFFISNMPKEDINNRLRYEVKLYKRWRANND